jgi:glycine/D-amino acid oxidase-like deaminating enzyme
VLVIGSGAAGSLISYCLQDSQVDTVVVDKRLIGMGSTSANTGLLQFANDKTLSACMHSFGSEKGERFYRLCKEAVDELETLAKGLEINPEFVRRDSLYYASCTEDVPALLQEYEALKTHGFDVSYLRQNEIEKQFSFSKPAAIYARGDADINPYKLVHGLIDAAHRQGLRVYQQTEMISHVVDGEGLLFFSKNRHKIRAQKAIIATGYEAQSFCKDANAVIESSYAIAPQPLSAFAGWPHRCLIWETARPYLYLRTTADNRIVAGGFDETTMIAHERDAHLLRKRDLLLQTVQTMFPDMPDLRAEYFWSAHFGNTHDGVPLIGCQAAYPNCYFALGYGGNGTVYSAIAARIIRDLICQGYHPDADIFAFDRS